MKRTNREQIVPLSTQTVALFKRAIELSEGNAYVFPADASRACIGIETRTAQPGNGEALRACLAQRRSGPRSPKDGDEVASRGKARKVQRAI